jgi:3-phenylpropionate/cinnamic acid dioxygenase small subunit
MSDLERFVYLESKLLDERKYLAWLDILTPDVTYWIPNYDNNGPPDECGAIVFEHLLELRARVERTLDRRNPTQQPSPRTQHFLTNILVDASADGTTAAVSASLLLYVAKDQQVLSFPGHCDYTLRNIDGAWRIAAKTINLLGNAGPLSSMPIV